MRRTTFLLLTSALLLFAAAGAEAATYSWQTLTMPSWMGGSMNMVTDGTTLYAVSGTSIYKYNGPANDTWTEIAGTAEGNPNPYIANRNGGRSFYWNGRIVSSSPGNDVSVFDLSTNTWTDYSSPPLSSGATYGWTQGMQFNPVTGMIQERWTETPFPTPYAPYNESWYNLTTGTWGTHTVVSGPVDGFASTSTEWGTDKIYRIVGQTGNQVVTLQIYDLNTQPSDFNGTWTNVTYDLGAGRTFYWSASNHPWVGGADNLSVDPITGKVYLSSSLSYDAGGGDYVGITLVYDPATDTWEDDFPLHHGTGDYGYYNVCEAGGYLYTYASQSGSFQAMQIIPEPATMVLLGLGSMGLLIRRKK